MSSNSLYKRKKENKRGIRFTFMVTGAQGTGKTSFINSLLDQNLINHRYISSPQRTIPKTITFSNLSSINASELQRTFDPLLASQEPGIAITETSVEIIDEDDSKILLTIIDTPGFGDNINNEICINEVSNFLEQQFDLVLAEETKVRRNPRFEDTRVHACIYFIEPTGHGLRELDVETMLKISKYVNILPVIGRADSFTKLELINFKRNVIQDIERFKIPIFQFNCDDDEDDEEIIQESQYLSQLQPFAIVTSDVEAELNGQKTRVRQYPWGVIDINDSSVSDFPLLKSVLLGSHLQEFKDITHDFLYEAYRTEKLSSVTDLKDDFEVTSKASTMPSMSNLAEIANSRSMAKFDIPQSNNTNSNNNGGYYDITMGMAKSTIKEEEEEEEESAEGKDNEHQVEEKRSIATNNESTNEASHDVNESINQSLNSPQLSTRSSTVSSHFGQSQTVYPRHSDVDPMKLRKISETVPYMLRHESIRTKHAKIEDLERQSALELARRAAELEKRAMELKLREKALKEKLESSSSISLNTEK